MSDFASSNIHFLTLTGCDLATTGKDLFYNDPGSAGATPMEAIPVLWTIVAIVLLLWLLGLIGGIGGGLINLLLVVALVLVIVNLASGRNRV